ncbi:hypothetical protein H310_06493 [Aphanomyces invadans]|uniref:EamA domain-containing protein n=1 Tax=Aphanomyces invadans TaxID=157072 RepID=A0A024U6Z1_9STRA|nr:hypothetical protein H310_06493 [Aphanomyces invadans]ETW01965.1 hypothetical protein H310_06493 [Aphanomyces invadans]|eukprot:XP_008869813.1 hypothetical protein H310_06493 [Aphanomyces invadans]
MPLFFARGRTRVTICPGNVPTEIASAPLLGPTNDDDSCADPRLLAMSPVGRGALSTTCSSPSKYRRSNLPFAFHCKVERIRQRTGSLYGLALIAGGNVIFSFMAVLIKSAGNYLTSEETVFWRSTVALVLNVAIQLRLKISPFAVAPEFRKLLVCRAVIGYIAMALSFYAYSTMILSEAQVILCASPLVTFVLGVCCLGEVLDRIEFGCVAVSFVGVVCVARPAFLFGGRATSAASNGPMACAILASCLIGVINILIRKLSALNTWTLVTYVFLSCSTFSLLKLTVFDEGLSIPTDPAHVLTVLGIGILGCVGQIMITKGLQIEKAGIGSAMMYINILCVMVWDVTLLGETLHAWSVLGAAIICTAAFTIAYRKARRRSN